MKTYAATYTSKENNQFTGYFNAPNKATARAMAEVHCIGIWVKVSVKKHTCDLVLRSHLTGLLKQQERLLRNVS